MIKNAPNKAPAQAPAQAQAKAREQAQAQAKPKINISRTFYEDRMNVPHGKKRLTAMSYTYYSKTGELRYAAALFREDFPNEMEKNFLNKKNLKRELRKTALDRLENKYLTLNIPKNFEMPITEVYGLVRKAIAKNGAYRRPKKKTEKNVKKTDSSSSHSNQTTQTYSNLLNN